MSTNNHRAPSLGHLITRTLSTGLCAVQNRGELFIVELQEELARLLSLIVLALAGLFLGMMTVLLLTGTIIFLTPPEGRVYVAAGFTLLYLGGGLWAFFTFKSRLKQIPFDETTAQFKKDRELLETFQ